jgi:hypothetical protein
MEEMAQLSKAVKDYMAKIGSRGGQAQVAKGFATLPEDERKANARKAAAARWGAKAKKKAKK